MSFFDNSFSADQGTPALAQRPGDLFLRNRAGMSTSSSSVTQSPMPRTAVPTTGLAAGIAAYKKGLAGEQSINRTAPQAAVLPQTGVLPQTSVLPKAKPIAAPVPPSLKATTAAPGGFKTGDVKKGDQGGGLSATVNRIQKRQADQAAKTPVHPLSVHPLSQDGTKNPARLPAVTAALPTPRAQKPRPAVPDAQTAAAVDGLLTEVTRWAQDLTGIDPQTRLDRLAKIWGWPYRGTYQPGSWGKDSVPELGTHAILDGIASRWPDMVPPHLLNDPDLIFDDRGNVIGRLDIKRHDPNTITPHLRNDPDVIIRDDGTIIRRAIARHDPKALRELQSAGAPSVMSANASASAAPDHATRRRAHSDVEDRIGASPDTRTEGTQVAFLGEVLESLGLGDGTAGDSAGQPAPPAFEPGETIADNHIMYGKMHDALQETPGAIRSKWFKAAAIVTGTKALGAADPYPWNGPVLMNEDEAYLRYVHHELAGMNADNFGLLHIGEEIPGLEGLRGKELDYALVELEQRRVSELTEAYFRDNPDANRDAIMESVSGANDPNWAIETFFMDEDVRDALRREFDQGTYDVSNEAHRVRLGKAIVDNLYEQDRSQE